MSLSVALATSASPAWRDATFVRSAAFLAIIRTERRASNIFPLEAAEFQRWHGLPKVGRLFGVNQQAEDINVYFTLAGFPSLKSMVLSSNPA